MPQIKEKTLVVRPQTNVKLTVDPEKSEGELIIKLEKTQLESALEGIKPKELTTMKVVSAVSKDRQNPFKASELNKALRKDRSHLVDKLSDLKKLQVRIRDEKGRTYTLKDLERIVRERGIRPEDMEDRPIILEDEGYKLAVDDTGRAEMTVNLTDHQLRQALDTAAEPGDITPLEFLKKLSRKKDNEFYLPDINKRLTQDKTHDMKNIEDARELKVNVVDENSGETLSSITGTEKPTETNSRDELEKKLTGAEERIHQANEAEKLLEEGRADEALDTLSNTFYYNWEVYDADQSWFKISNLPEDLHAKYALSALRGDSYVEIAHSLKEYCRNPSGEFLTDEKELDYVFKKMEGLNIPLPYTDAISGEKLTPKETIYFGIQAIYDKNGVEQKVQAKVVEGHFHPFREVSRGLTGNDEEKKTEAKEAAGKIISQGGLNAEEVIPLWLDNVDDYSKMLDFEKNLVVLSQLNKARPGAAKYLHDEYNLHVLGRYSPEALTRIYDDDRAGKKPSESVLMVYPLTDWNGAFYRDRDDVDKLVFDKNARVYECGTDKQFMESLKKQAEDIGPISTLIVSGHGKQDHITLGNYTHRENHFDPDDTTLDKDDFTEQGFEKIRGYLAPNARIILNSCSTGAGYETVPPKPVGTILPSTPVPWEEERLGKSIGHQMSISIPDATVTAPSRPVSSTIEIDADGKIIARYERDMDTRVVYRGGYVVSDPTLTHKKFKESHPDVSEEKLFDFAQVGGWDVGDIKDFEKLDDELKTGTEIKRPLQTSVVNTMGLKSPYQDFSTTHNAYYDDTLGLMKEAISRAEKGDDTLLTKTRWMMENMFKDQETGKVKVYIPPPPSGGMIVEGQVIITGKESHQDLLDQINEKRKEIIRDAYKIEDESNKET